MKSYSKTLKAAPYAKCHSCYYLSTKLGMRICSYSGDCVDGVPQEVNNLPDELTINGVVYVKKEKQ